MIEGEIGRERAGKKEYRKRLKSIDISLIKNKSKLRGIKCISLFPT